MIMRRFLVQCVLLVCFTLGALFFCIPSASAVGPESETPERAVECDNYVFVPMKKDGTWDCPPVKVPWVIPPGTIPGPEQVSPGGSHPFFNWRGIFDLFICPIIKAF